MASFKYDPFMRGISLSFKCSECGKSQKTYFYTIPTPFYDNPENSDAYNHHKYECLNCQKVYDITLHSNMQSGDGEICGLVDENLIEAQEESFDEWAYYKNLFDQVKEEIKEDRKYIDLFNESMASVEGVIETVNGLFEKDKKVMYPMLYVNLIASMEAYLADTFIKSVLENEEYKRKFIETFKDFRKQQIPLRAIYEKMDGIDEFISNTLRDVVYHNLGKVRKMYKDTLDVDLGNIEKLAKAISKRHDIVHRNCKDKEGNNVRINKEDVEELYKQVTEFVEKIDVQIHPEPMLEQEQ